jgi:hypothetical protein
VSILSRPLACLISTLGLAARVPAHAVRRRGTRGRRYIDRHISQPPRPHVVTGPIPIIWPSSRTDLQASTRPGERPRVGGLAPVIPLAARRRRVDASQRGLVVLIAIARQDEERGAAA